MFEVGEKDEGVRGKKSIGRRKADSEKEAGGKCRFRGFHRDDLQTNSIYVMLSG